MPTDLPPAPKDLGEEGKQLWDDIVGGWELDGSPNMLKILESACRCWDVFRRAERQVAADGLFQQGRYGQRIPHSGCDIMRRMHTNFLAAMKALGLETEQEEASRMRGPKRPGRPSRGSR